MTTNNLESPVATVIGSDGTDLRAAFGARRQAFRALHEAGCFVLPNPWDVGSARYLQHLGFAAVATTSADLRSRKGCRIPTSRSRAAGAWLISPRLPELSISR